MQQHAWNVLVIWRTSPWISYQKFQHSVWMIINLRKDDFEIVGEFADVCAHIVKTYLYQARIGRTRNILDSQRTGSSRAVTKSTDCATKKCGETKGVIFNALRIMVSFVMADTRPVHATLVCSGNIPPFRAS